MYNRFLKIYKNVYVAEQGILFTKHTQIKECYIFPDHITKFPGNFWLKLKKERSLKKIKTKNNLLLYNYWSSNYFHWLMDDLVRLKTILDKLPDIKFNVYIPENSPTFVKQSLSFFDVNIHYFSINEVLYFQEVYHANALSPSGLIHPSVADLRISLTGKSNNSKGKRKIYLSRQKTNIRYIENENAIFPILIANQFEIIYAEDLSFIDQIRLFEETEILISSHGAGLTNCLFMKAGSVLEIGSENIKDQPNCFSNLCNILNLNYYYVPVKFENNGYHLTNQNIETITRYLTLIGQSTNSQNTETVNRLKQ